MDERIELGDAGLSLLQLMIMLLRQGFDREGEKQVDFLPWRFYHDNL